VLKSFRELNPNLKDLAHCNRRLPPIKQNKSKLHTTLMEDCAQNRIAYTSRLIPTKSAELIELKQVLQTS
jgi:hypothetical protein